MKKMFLAVFAAGLCASASAGGGSIYAAHEWGTFTSVQGADGVQMEWNPYVVAELPKFVYDRNRPNHEYNRPEFALFAAKTAFVAKQRMETPVIYFYSPERKNVDVRVDFPAGLITEWYPHATTCDAERLAPGVARPKNSYLEWKGIEVGAMSTKSGEKLPEEKGKSHYYAARETDSSMLRVLSQNVFEPEKFLFYRGVGHFEAPLNVTLQNDGSKVTLQNTGQQELRHLFVMQVKGQSISLTAVNKLAPESSQEVSLTKMEPSSKAALKAALQKALASAGLYEAEAKAMVKTWEDSWLDEQGLRVLYVLSDEWTRQTLPLKITPQPEETVRVMVGRAEVIAPKVEIALEESIKQFMKGNRDQAVAKARALGLGRFQEAAVRRLIKTNPGEAFSKAAFEVISKAMEPPKTPPVALK